jgi:serine protease Do
VTAINGGAVSSSRLLRNLVASGGPDRSIALVVNRDGKLLDVQVKLSEAPQVAADSAAQPSEAGAFSGLSVAPLSRELARKFRLDSRVRGGVVIVDIAPDSVAEAAGLQPGDVLVEVNRRPISTPQEFQAAYAASTGQVLLWVQRGGERSFLVLPKQ